MSRAVASLRAGVARFLKSPLNAVLLALIVLAGIVLGPMSVAGSPELFRATPDWLLAGRTFQGAAMFAGLAACAWSASAVLDDRDSGRLEALVCSGCGPVRYLLSKVTVPFVALLAAGVLVGVVVAFLRVVFVGSADVFAYAAAGALVYLPIIAFASCFGLGVAVLSGSRSFALALFAVLWMGGILPGLPAQMNALDVTGAALDQLLFQPVLVVGDLSGVDGSLAQLAVDASRANLAWARYNPAFLVLGGLLLCGAAVAKVSWQWAGDASALIEDPARKGGMAFPLPTFLLELSAMRAGRVAAVAVVALLLGLLPFAVEDPGELAAVVMESLVPLCFAFAYAGIFASDAKRKTCEVTLCLPHYRLLYARRLVVVTVALVFTLALQGIVFHEAIGESLPSAVLRGLAPALLLGGAGYVLGILTKSESTASLLAAITWIGLQVAGSLAEAARAAFPLAAGISAEAVTDVLRILILLAGVVLIAVGQVLLGRTERRLLT